ncbi:malonyl-CoA/methylmalonyl-CoA synthetase [Gemmobacter megaterium]|uniref:Malonyl-CoA/methylmalonyl-CoA synthetase n=1 Tax=Gemmobacter megaterium TaxID=1086013 RepID=A0A1N7PR89_9RHOB|nr:malonyl-CoA synthase [Gemmobacter megaterium]GGE20790.1 malonyl-CoA synthase [Gemmobacter megaterium]SIT13096.1 malonyl-CoA/methylmalonyl-CoA synthetase [Gemmobacter megaterium]
MTNPLYDALVAPLAARNTPVLTDAAGRTLSGTELHDMALALATALTGLGLQPGDRMAVQIDKSPRALALYLAALASGVVFLPLNTAYTADEVEYFVSNAGAALLVGSPTRADSLRAVATRHGARFETMDAAGDGSLTDLAGKAPAGFVPVDRGPEDLAAILYTSGTTGRSKGAMLSQRNLLSNAEVLVEEWRFTDTDVLLHMLPIFHTHGLFVATNVVLLSGGSMIFLPGFKAEQAIDWLPKATTMMGVPTFYTRLLDDPRFTGDLVGHMRLFTSGSAPLLAETHVQFEERTGHRILERYGMTETNMNTSNPYDGDRRAGTVGLPLPGVELKITDPVTGATLPQGEPGMIEVRGANVFKGYWQMPEKTKEELRDDGFFITGDIGVVDADGYVSIVGRQKDLIITGGYNVYPKEIELILDEQPGVLESAVVGVPHPDFGEAVVGVLVAQPGQTIDVDVVRAAMGQSLAKFKQPKHIAVVQELPRNTMGKVQKNLLRKDLSALFA